MKNRGFWGIGIYHPKFEVNCGTLWRSAHAFGASMCFTIGARFKKQASDISQAWHHVPFFQFDTIESLKKHLPYDAMLIGIELNDKARPLDKFCHPERALYLLGAEDHGLPEKVMNQCHHLIQIPNLNLCLNVSTAGSLVMYDRQIKQQR